MSFHTWEKNIRSAIAEIHPFPEWNVLQSLTQLGTAQLIPASSLSKALFISHELWTLEDQTHLSTSYGQIISFVHHTGICSRSWASTKSRSNSSLVLTFQKRLPWYSTSCQVDKSSFQDLQDQGCHWDNLSVLSWGEERPEISPLQSCNSHFNRPFQRQQRLRVGQGGGLFSSMCLLLPATNSFLRLLGQSKQGELRYLWLKLYPQNVDDAVARRLYGRKIGKSWKRELSGRPQCQLWIRQNMGTLVMWRQMERKKKMSWPSFFSSFSCHLKCQEVSEAPDPNHLDVLDPS